MKTYKNVRKQSLVPTVEHKMAAYRSVSDAQRKLDTLRIVYTETERAIYIHTRQLNLHHGQENLYLEDGANFKYLIDKMNTYNAKLNKSFEELKLNVKSGRITSIKSVLQDILDMKAVKFEPALSTNSSVLGYLVEYDITDLCFSYQAAKVQDIDNKNVNTTTKTIDLHTKVLKGSPSAPILCDSSSGYHSQSSLCETPKSSSRRGLRQRLPSRVSDVVSMTPNSQGFLWTSRLTSTEVHKSKKQHKGVSCAGDVAMLPDGNIVTVDATNSAINMFDSTGKFVRSLGQPKLTKILGDWKLRPQCITASREGQVFITDLQDQCIKQFNPTHGRFTAIIPLINYSNPFSVALLKDDKFVVTHSDDFITIHDPSGRTVKTIYSEGNFWYVCCDDRNRIITSDSSNHCVRIFDTNGKLLQSLGQENGDEACLSYPHGVTVAPNGQILVADSVNNRVCRYNASGSFMDSVISPDCIQWPRGISTDGTHIAVTWSGGLSLADYPVPPATNFLTTYL